MADLSWVNDIDVSLLSAEDQENYQEYKTAYRMMTEAKARFEGGMNASYGLPKDGKALVFNYRFGKLSIAIGEQAEAKAPAKGKVNLAAFLQAQGFAGRAA